MRDFETIAIAEGWTAETQVEVLLQYVANQDDNPALSDFCEEYVAQERAATCAACGALLTAGDRTLGNCGQCKTPVPATVEREKETTVAMLLEFYCLTASVPCVNTLPDDVIAEAMDARSAVLRALARDVARLRLLASGIAVVRQGETLG